MHLLLDPLHLTVSLLPSHFALSPALRCFGRCRLLWRQNSLSHRAVHSGPNFNWSGPLIWSSLILGPWQPVSIAFRKWKHHRTWLCEDLQIGKSQGFLPHSYIEAVEGQPMSGSPQWDLHTTQDVYSSIGYNFLGKWPYHQKRSISKQVQSKQIKPIYRTNPKHNKIPNWVCRLDESRGFCWNTAQWFIHWVNPG